MNKTMIYFVVGTLVLVGGLTYALASTRSERSAAGSADELRALATCLSEKGATFYGAFWCPHCQEQKSDFGDAKDLIPYVECATLGGNSQTDECAAAGVTSYPTWEFPDGTRKTGRIALTDLAEITGCPAPTLPVSAESVEVPLASPETAPPTETFETSIVTEESQQ